MTEVLYLDEHNQPIESDREIRAALDEITDILAAMKKHNCAFLNRWLNAVSTSNQF